MHRFTASDAARCGLLSCLVLARPGAVDCQAQAQPFFNPPVVSGHFELSPLVHVDEADGQSRAQLERVRAFLEAQQWDEATEILGQIVESGGDKVIQFDERRYATLASYCQRQIAALPQAALELYRERVDPLAQPLYVDGLARRDRAKLASLVAQMIASSFGDDALLALGELSLEEGNCTAARGYWDMLIPLPPECIPAAQFEAVRKTIQAQREHATLVDAWYERRDGPPPVYCLRKKDFLPDDVRARLVQLWNEHGVLAPRLCFPDSSTPLADIRARLVLVSILEGSLARARGEIKALGRLHPDAHGQLGGRRVKLQSALETLVQAAEHWPAPKYPAPWTTLAGSVARNQHAPGAIALGGHQWKQPISLGERIKADAANSAIASRRIAERADGLLSYHPVVAGELLLVCNDWQIFAYRLKSGEPAWSSAPGRPAGEIYYDENLKSSHRARGAVGVPRFTLTVEGKKLYAKLGSPVTSRPADATDPEPSKLVCLDLAADGMLLWSIGPDDGQWAFEGAPVAQGKNVYVAMRKSDVHPQAHVACLDAATGRERWRRMVCSAETPGGGQVEEITHNLLTLDHGTLYFNTNLGAIASLSGATGQINWITLYGRAKKTRDEAAWRRWAVFQRDLNPCIHYRGKLLAAPADSAAIFALDATTGRMLWETQHPLDVVHLLGVGGGNLLASGDSLWWIDVESGKIAGHFPDSLPAAGPFGYGRGLLAGGMVYWPTREHLYVFDQRSPGLMETVLRDKIPLVEQYGASGGNLVLASGVLVVAAADKLYAVECHARERPPIARRAAGSRSP